MSILLPLYIGVTSNMIKRIYEHKNSFVDGFSKKHKLHMLVYLILKRRSQEKNNLKNGTDYGN